MAVIWKWVTKFEKKFFEKFLEKFFLCYKYKFSRVNMTRKYDLHYQSCAIANRLRNNRFSRSEIRMLVFVINIANIGLILKQINTGTRQKVSWVILGHSRSFKIRFCMLNAIKIIFILKFQYLTLVDLKWPWMTPNDLLSCSPYNLLQNKPNIGYV